MRLAKLVFMLIAFLAPGWPALATAETELPKWTLSVHAGSGDVDFKDLVGRIRDSHSEMGVAADVRVMDIGIYVGIGFTDYGALIWHPRLAGPGPGPLSTKLDTRGLDIHLRGVTPSWHRLRASASIGHIRFEVEEPAAALSTVPSGRVWKEIALQYGLTDRISLGLSRRSTGFDSDATLLILQFGW